MELPLAKRRHPRVDAGFLVKVHTPRKTFVCTALDLSMTGVLVANDSDDLDDRVVVEIPLPDEQRVVSVSGRVIRDSGSAQSAIHFLDLDWDDMFALARFLAPRLP